MENNGERLQKYLARAGIASRRKCEECITAGRVSVNGEVVSQLGSKVRPGDVVLVDDRPVEPEPLEYYLLNKPAGVISAVSDPRGEKTVSNLIPSASRLYPVGRLDRDTTGLLVLTNDGELANKLMHPSFEVDKVYTVTVEGRLTEGKLQRLRKGIKLEGRLTAPAEASWVENGGPDSVVELVIHEGRKRQVRKMMEALGHRVKSLHRRKYAMLTDEGLCPGEYRPLDRKEVEALRLVVGRGPA
jgi:23S rRNA pseudouridine2605 synthase